ncbi:MAG: TSUP family transporter [Hyphomicrobiales bacterium]|nr:TSUP family transporter [Hyphomicrobiales bacterium]MDE2114476.1 sulfite exporter TauE/SafE family protein [Hyphomicrobiales bacterium]
MTSDLTLNYLLILWSGAFLGAFVAGAGGFGFALAASSIWLHRLTPVQTTTLIVGCGAILHCGMVWPMRRSIILGRLWPFVAGCLLGIPLGVRLLATLDFASLKHILGALLVCFGLYAALVRRLPHLRIGGRGADATVGFMGGILGGLGGFSGVLPMMWTQLRGWSPNEARAVYQPYIIVAQLATLLMMGVFGLDRSGLWLIVLSLPALLAGVWLGWKLFGYFDEPTFRRVVAVGVALSGLSLIF